ncbi:hypothetical protein GCM10009706_30000 [Curtobacterium citreum]|nr:hypothetical protein GCM10009706_30000 [Curtobacterium citreum]
MRRCRVADPGDDGTVSWSGEALLPPSTFTVPVDAQDVLDGGALAAGSELSLGAWDVRVVAVR